MARALKLRAAMARGAQWSMLVPHPDTPAAAVSALAIEAHFAGPGVLVCECALHADISRVRLPPAHGGERRDELWRHTCFEAFVGAPGLPGYYEFNFSPAGDWAAYHFEDYRHGRTPAMLVQAPGLHVQLSATRLELSARVELAGLPGLAESAALRLGLAAVIEDEAGRLSYWALQHAPGRPDFHHPDGFALELEAP